MQLADDHLEAVNIGLVVVNVIWGGGKLECKDNMGAIMGHTFMRAEIIEISWNEDFSFLNPIPKKIPGIPEM